MVLPVTPPGLQNPGGEGGQGGSHTETGLSPPPGGAQCRRASGIVTCHDFLAPPSKSSENVLMSARALLRVCWCWYILVLVQ